MDFYEIQKQVKRKELQIKRSNWNTKEVESSDEQIIYIQKFVGSSMCFEISLFK